MNSPVARVAQLPSGQSTDRREGTIATPIRILTNKSCDFCRRRKRRCDGDGVNPCSRCKALPGGKCTFSQRKLHRSRRTQIRPSSSWVQYGQRRGLLGGGHSLRRCEFSPSPATGLVGTMENALLKDFFSCMGFIQLVGQNVVREAMVRIMITTTSSSLPASLNGKSTGTEMDETTHEDETTWLREAADLPMDAGSCSFWCAVAIGGLMQGRSREMVEGYASKAKAALESCSNEAMTPELARAFVQMAILHALTGDQETLHIYVERALTFLQDPTTNGSPCYELIYLIKHAQGMGLFIGAPPRKEDMMTFVGTGLVPLPKVGEEMTQEEMSRFVMYAYHRTGWAFFMDILSSPNKVEFGLDEIEPLRYDFAEPIPSGCSERFWEICYHDTGINHGLWEKGAGTSEAGTNMLETIREVVPVYERMQEAMERPGVRMGIGALIINLSLCLSRAGKRDMKGAVDRAGRCVEILMAYPGLFRLDSGLHGAHLLMMFLSRTGSTELYEKLRTVYNKHQLDGSPDVPPMEEWGGITSYCRHIYCRTSEAMMKEQEALYAKAKIPYGDNEAVCIGISPTNRGSKIFTHTVMDDLTQSEQSSDTPPEFFVESEESIMPSALSNVGVESFVMPPASAFAGSMATASKSGNDLIDHSDYDALGGHVLAPEDWRMVVDTLLETGHMGT